MKQKLWPYSMIYILTVLDVALTSAGLQIGVIEEANPVMLFFIQRSLVITMAGVLVFVAAALYFFYKVRFRIQWIMPALIGIIGIKLWVLIAHAAWIMAL